MSKCELCECRGYCEWRLDSEVSCDDIKAEFEKMKGADDDGFDEGLDECRWRDSEAPDADDFCSYGEREGE